MKRDLQRNLFPVRSVRERSPLRADLRSAPTGDNESGVKRCLASDYKPTTGQPEAPFLEALASKHDFPGFIGN